MKSKKKFWASFEKTYWWGPLLFLFLKGGLIKKSLGNTSLGELSIMFIKILRLSNN